MMVLAAPLRGIACPPGTFDYGPPCDNIAGQIVLCHHGGEGVLVPDPQECARAERDLGLIGDLGLGEDPSWECGVEPRVILIETLAPTDPELACTNQHYQVESFVPAGFGDWWIVRFPRPVNESAMAVIYSSLPAVLVADTNGYGYICPPVHMEYSALPDGTWHWVAAGTTFSNHGCSPIFRHTFVSRNGMVIMPGDLDCDGLVSLSDVEPFVEALISPATFSGCNPFPADVNGDGARDGADVRSFIRALIT